LLLKHRILGDVLQEIEVQENGAEMIDMRTEVMTTGIKMIEVIITTGEINEIAIHQGVEAEDVAVLDQEVEEATGMITEGEMTIEDRFGF